MRRFIRISALTDDTMVMENIVLAVMDTLRYGRDQKIDTRNLFGSEIPNVLVFDKAISPSSWTLPAHVSMFTGQYQREHGIHENARLKESIELLTKFEDFTGERISKALGSRGYNTYGIVANPALMPGTGFEVDFDEYSLIDFLEPLGSAPTDISAILDKRLGKKNKELFVGSEEDFRNSLDALREQEPDEYETIIKKADELNRISASRFYPRLKGGRDLIRKIRSVRLKEPFFLFLNFMEAHDPHDQDGLNLVYGDGRGMLADLVGAKTIPNERIERIKTNYSESVQEIRSLVDSLMASLSEKGVLNNTMVVLTSDHGQALKERNFYGHGTFLYDEITHVPFAVKLPKEWKPQDVNVNVNHPVSLVSLKNAFINISEGTKDLSVLNSETVFSESYGIPNNYYEMFGADSPITRALKKYDAKRVSILSDNSRLTLNCATGSIEDASLQFSKATVSREDLIEKLANQLLNFARSKEACNLPDVDQLVKHLTQL